MDLKELSTVWVFNGQAGRFPSGVFTSVKDAENWIRANSLTGVLTEYPLNMSTYDWAVEQGFFLPRKESEKESCFIQKFTSASQQHYHYEDGSLGS